MTNKYPGVCYRCGGHVAPGEGVFEKIGSRQIRKWGRFTRNNWHVQHHECAKRWRGTSQHYQFNDLRCDTDAD